MLPFIHTGTLFAALTMKLNVDDHWVALGIVNNGREVEVPVEFLSCYLKQ